MCALINSKSITFDSKFEVINSVLTITFIVICSLLPIVIVIFLLVRFSGLGSLTMKVKYGELTKGLDLSKGRAIILTPINFLARRYLLALVVVYSS